MTAFNSKTDVGNRALQHCGALRMGTAGFTEASKNASEVSFCYDKLREAELQRRFWKFAIKRTTLRAIETTTMLLAPGMWVSTTTYFVGSIVSDQFGNLWISNARNNLSNDPLLTSMWEPFYGPLTVSLYDSATAYFAGEIVYTYTGNGLALTYISLQNANSDVPATATAYSAATTYFKNQVVTYLGVAYMSLLDLNLNNLPTLSPLAFNFGTTYSIGQTVTGSDGVIYQSAINGNVARDPVSDDGTHWTNTGVLCPWTTVFVAGTGSIKWSLIGGPAFPNGVGLTTLNLIYPIGAGPAFESNSKKVFRLPAGYLRKANQNPKPALNPLGGPSGVQYDDWLIENGYLITAQAGPITLRFVANVTDVSRMHAMFCEGLAARIGLEVCEPITQSTSKLAAIGKIYDRWMIEAGTVDAIEEGFEDSPDDTYLTVRY